MEPSQVGSGLINGGMGYVWAVYGVTWLVLGLYTLRTFTRPIRSAR